MDTLKTRGFGITSGRIICGTSDLHLELEERISKFYEQEASITFTSCYDANEAIFETLFDEQDVVLTDQLNHASIINGIRLSKCSRKIYKNGSMEELE
jgi:glycine C-acetyltransferase